MTAAHKAATVQAEKKYIVKVTECGCITQVLSVIPFRYDLIWCYIMSVGRIMIERIKEHHVVYEKKRKWVAQKWFKCRMTSLIEKLALKERPAIR